LGVKRKRNPKPRMIVPAKANIPGSKSYIGNSDGPAPRHRAGMDEWIRQAVETCPALWNNGSYVLRDMRGKPGSLSVHATGRAVDLSYRHLDGKGIPNGRKTALGFISLCAMNGNDLGIQAVLDYFPKPFGRGWRCDRQKWSRYSKPVIGGAPGGDWVHFELSPEFADSPALVRAAWLKVFGVIHN